jgi:type I restriction-modification system DNA methylase subunit
MMSKCNADFNAFRVKNNLQALTSLVSNTPCSETLKKYSGWGGLKNSFYDHEIYKILKKVLNNKEFDEIKKTLRTAYYTPRKLVDFIYKVIFDFGFHPKTILEPSAGHGIFIDCLPKHISRNSKITAVETDIVSCRMLNALYPNIEVFGNGFENLSMDKKYDLIVGNPPFGQLFVEDALNPELACYSIHHYFVAKCMRLLNQDGILAMILPRYFMDASQKHVRNIIASEGGSLITAFRLPDNLFENAKVTVDVVFLRKSLNHIEWVTAKPYREAGNFAFMNEFFLKNPNNIIGEIKFFDFHGRTEITCKQKCNDIYLELSQRISNYFDTIKKLDMIYKGKETIRKYIKSIDCKIYKLNDEREKLMKFIIDISKVEKNIFGGIS